MLRRRAIMNIQAPDYDWDVAWDYTMGLPEDNGVEKAIDANPQIEGSGNKMLTAQHSTAQHSTQDCSLTDLTCQAPEVILCHF